MHSTLVSYARQDAEFAERLVDLLERRGMHVVRDEAGLVSGEPVSNQVASALEKADAVVVLLSRHSKRNRWVESTLTRALEAKKDVVPVLLDSEATSNWVWPLVADKQALTITGGRGEERVAAYVAALAGLRDAVEPATRARPATLDERATSLPVPIAFVIMPFEEVFSEVYSYFISAALVEAGYEVVRADDLRNQQNILKDILTGLNDSALVVADLTGGNPNVYYELGLAHGLGKNVILLTQELEDLPFDLRSYRVISYGTHFAEILKAKEKLRQTAVDALLGRIVFGSPVTDFAARAPRHATSVATSLSEPVQDDRLGEPGLLDLSVELEEGFENLAKILGDVSSEMSDLTAAMTDSTERLAQLKASNSPARIRYAMVVSLGARLQEFSASLGKHNERYAMILSSTRSSLESMIRAQRPVTDEERTQVREFLTVLDQTQVSVEAQRTSLSSVIENVRSVPRIERTFNRAAESTIRSLEGYWQNVDQTLAMIVRSRDLASAKLVAERSE